MGYKVPLALVGAGNVARAYAQALGRCKAARLVAVADVLAVAAHSLARQFGCQGFESTSALADAGGFEAVVVCTPPATHEAISAFFLRRGVAVLCEKPLTPSVAGTRRLLAAARKARATLAMASKFRHVPDVVRARDLVGSGKLGEVLRVEVVFASPVDMSGRWNSDPAVGGGGVLIDNGPHAVDLMRYFLGPLDAVQAVEGRRVQGLPVEDTVYLAARAASGVVATADLSWSYHACRDSYLTVYGTRGVASVGWQDSRIRTGPQDAGKSFGNGYDKVEAFRGQLDNFARALRGQEDMRITPDDALASAEAVEAAYRSLRRGRWVPVRRGGKIARPRDGRGGR